MQVGKWGILHHWALGKLNSMGSWCTELSDYMGGWCRRKLNSMGGWVKKKVPSSPPGVFFWNSPYWLCKKTISIEVCDWTKKFILVLVSICAKYSRKMLNSSSFLGLGVVFQHSSKQILFSRKPSIFKYFSSLCRPWTPQHGSGG